jgi:hypothetical protein
MGDGTLAQFLPDKTRTASIRDVNGQMALFDHLVAYEDITKIIDVAHEAYEAFFFVGPSHWICRRSAAVAIAVPILFIVAPDHTSVTAYRSLRARFAHATLAPVHNEMLGPAQHRDKYPLTTGRPARRRVCAGTWRRRLFRSPIRVSPIQPVFPLPHTPSLSGGYAEFIWSSASSIYGYCWWIYSHPSNLARIYNSKGTESAVRRFLGRTFPARCSLAERGSEPCGLHSSRSLSGLLFASLSGRRSWNPMRKTSVLDQ